MNTELWNKIIDYDFDSPMREYGFSTRLSNENYWTKNFTKKAILEYKKFMYLAAVSEMMVSPSEIVDVVWHQHLVFTQSYSDFCRVLGKQIQHVPSTHSHADAEKFQQAKERTNRLYGSVFGEQPREVWDYPGMFDGLQLKKAKLKIRGFVLIGILIFAFMVIPSYWLLRPVYVQIGNPDFIIGYIILIGLAISGLQIYSRSRLSKMLKQIDERCFVFDLDPMEVVYLESQEVSNVINGVINQMVFEQKIQVATDHALQSVKSSKPTTLAEYTVMETLERTGQINYQELLKILKDKPVFANTVKCMDAFNKYFIKSIKFSRLFYFNFGVLSIVAMLGFVRLLTGLFRNRPVEQLAVLMIVLLIVIIVGLNRLTRLMSTRIVPNFYRQTTQPENSQNDWGWQYFRSGTAVLMPAFAPLVMHVEKNGADTGSGSCGSSCGSSCSSCGGCGGD